MKCPYCLYSESKVIDSRPADDGQRIRRRRECIQCGKRFTTYEIIETQPVIIIKRDKSRQVFDRNKLLSGMLRACEKRPISMDQIDAVVDQVESQIQRNYEREIPSEKVGEFTLDALRSVDEVAYVRFACVYRQFQDVHTFMAELQRLIQEK